MNKRGQITLFVVIGLLLVGAIVLFLVMRGGLLKTPVSAEEAQKIISAQTAPILDLQERCTREVSMIGFNKLGMQAGYYNYAPLQTIDFAGNKVIVIFKEGDKMVSKLPSIESIEAEFTAYMNGEGYDALDNCTDNFKGFKKILDDVQEDKAKRKITADIGDDDVIINVEWPMTLKRGDASTLVSAKNVSLLIPGIIFKVANDISNMEIAGTEFSGADYDKYMYDNTEKVKNIGVDIRTPDVLTRIMLMSSVPYRKGEVPYYFYFGIKK